jgi:DNA-binding PadR family transcriptional regulator
MESLLLLDRAVLAALARHGPATGRGVNRKLGAAAPVHPVLRRLEREQLVTSLPLAGSVRRARLYRITRRGQEMLAALRLWAGSSWANGHKSEPDVG